MNLFVDSSAWEALYDASDKYHPAAANALRNLTNTKTTFYTSDYIFDETITLLLGRSSHQQASQCGDWLLSSARVRLIRIGVAQWYEAWQLFHQYDDKAFSFTDCTSFIVMRQFKLREAFTFDRHFEQMGFRLWPK